MISTGDIKDKKYQIIGIVGAVVNDQAQTSSCGGLFNSSVSTDVDSMYNKGAASLLELAQQKGGDAVIYASFEYRIALNAAKQQVKELYCYGTAVKLGN